MPLLILRNTNFELLNPLKNQFNDFFRGDKITSHTVLLWETKEMSSIQLTKLFKYYETPKFKDVYRSLETGLLINMQDPRHPKYTTGLPVKYIILYDAYPTHLFTYNYIPIPKLSLERVIQEKDFGSYVIGIVMLKYDQETIVCKYIKSENLSNWIKI